jgi:hypothetical protein
MGGGLEKSQGSGGFGHHFHGHGLFDGGSQISRGSTTDGESVANQAKVRLEGLFESHFHDLFSTSGDGEDPETIKIIFRPFEEGRVPGLTDDGFVNVPSLGFGKGF